MGRGNEEEMTWGGDMRGHGEGRWRDMGREDGQWREDMGREDGQRGGNMGHEEGTYCRGV